MSFYKKELNLIKENLAEGDNPIKSIENIFLDRTVLIVSAGPSASKWYEVYLRLKEVNPIVVCIKQTIELNGLSELCDIHFINPFNLKKYDYKSVPLIVFSDAKDAPKVWNQYDIRYVVDKGKLDGLETTLAYKRNFDDYFLSNTGMIRPWGPGIMYESVLYTLVHMGVNKIVTVGWDIADNQGSNSHFYDQKTLSKKIDGFIRVMCTKLGLVRLYNRISYVIGRKYNHAGMMVGEAKVTADSIPSINNWLSSKGIELEIVTDSIWMNK
jgi:hypothetical protein